MSKRDISPTLLSGSSHKGTTAQRSKKMPYQILAMPLSGSRLILGKPLSEPRLPHL